MAKAYDKDFLVSVYLSRFINIDINKLCELEDNANKFYDKVGKDEFRKYASVDAEAIRTYNASL